MTTTKQPYQYIITAETSPLSGMEQEYQKLVRQYGPIQAKHMVTAWLQGEKV